MTFLKAALKNWKTTIAGLALVLGAASAIAQDPSKLFDKATDAALIAGIGMIASKDGDKTGVPAT